jgi:hypothetical protein
VSETFVDFLGNEVKVGDFVVYATTSGRSPVQKYALVEVIRPITRTRWKRVDGVSVTEQYTDHKVGVRELSNARGFTRWDSYDWKDGYRVQKQVRTTYPMKDNIVKVRSAEDVEQ